MHQCFGTLSDGRQATLYTIRSDKLQAQICDFGAALIRLYVPDRHGNTADVVLGCDDLAGYIGTSTYFGATIGRNANRLKNACFVRDGKTWTMPANEKTNNLHSGPDGFDQRLWKVEELEKSSICLSLFSPAGDQGLPGNVKIRVTYQLDGSALRIRYDAISDRDTLLNLTNHSYFNLAGHDHPEKAMQMTLSMAARFFLPDDAQNIPTGECRPVDGTPMDFRAPKPIGRDIDYSYDALMLQGGYDHNFEVFCDPCAILRDPESGRTMAVSTDRSGIQFYSGNFLNGIRGKDGVLYSKRSGICLETQFYPDSANHPEWPQPFLQAGVPFHSETVYRFI